MEKDEVEDIKKLITTHSSVGVVGVHGIPSNQLQLMRKSLRGSGTLRCAGILLLIGHLKNHQKMLKKSTNMLKTRQRCYSLMKSFQALQGSGERKDPGFY